MAAYENPMKPVVQAIREVMLSADPRVDECIKWQAPTFTFNGNIASFYPRANKHASLMFHQGRRSRVATRCSRAAEARRGC